MFFLFFQLLLLFVIVVIVRINVSISIPMLLRLPNLGKIKKLLIVLLSVFKELATMLGKIFERNKIKQNWAKVENLGIYFCIIFNFNNNGNSRLL